MALFECPDCHGMVSDQASSCPRCGRPVAQVSGPPPPPQAVGDQPAPEPPAAPPSPVVGTQPGGQDKRIGIRKILVRAALGSLLFLFAIGSSSGAVLALFLLLMFGVGWFGLKHSRRPGLSTEGGLIVGIAVVYGLFALATIPFRYQPAKEAQKAAVEQAAQLEAQREELEGKLQELRESKEEKSEAPTQAPLAAIRAIEIENWQIYTPPGHEGMRRPLESLAQWQIATDPSCSDTDSVTFGKSSGLYFISCLHPSGRAIDGRNVFYSREQVLSLHASLEAGDVPSPQRFRPAKTLSFR